MQIDRDFPLRPNFLVTLWFLCYPMSRYWTPSISYRQSQKRGIVLFCIPCMTFCQFQKEWNDPVSRVALLKWTFWVQIFQVRAKVLATCSNRSCWGIIMCQLWLSSLRTKRKNVIKVFWELLASWTYHQSSCLDLQHVAREERKWGVVPPSQ